MPSQSNVQAYKQFGNSVSVSVVAALAYNIKKVIESKRF
jgi:site-specific DNA-cytosine methylase